MSINSEWMVFGSTTIKSLSLGNLILKVLSIVPKAGILKLDAVDAVDAVHPVPTKTGCSASSTY
jgi:hypothetical protein